VLDPLSVSIALGAGGVAAAIAYLQWPRPPELDGERWFKTFLVTLLRGELEAAGYEAWEAAARSWVLYHPAGRFPERKVMNPLGAKLPGALVDGERALIESLQELKALPERWARMYDDDEAARAMLLDDPIELGAAYDPATYVGLELGWEAVAAWGAGDTHFGDHLRKRLAARWFLVEGAADPGVIPALAELLGEDGIRVPDGDEDLGERLQAALPEMADRCILLGEESGVPRILNALKDRAALRDQVLAVISVGGVIGGREEDSGPLGITAREDWLAAWFQHRHLDSEVVRMTPYMSVQWLDRAHWPPGARGLSIANARFPIAPEEPIETIEVVDLGLLPADEALPVAQVARALWAVATCWVLSRR